MSSNSQLRVLLTCLLVSLFSTRAEDAPVTRISFITAKLDWSFDFYDNGSARIQYGSLVIDSAETLPGLFNLAQIAKKIDPYLVDKKTAQSQLSVAVSNANSNNTTHIVHAKYLRDANVVKDLLLQVFAKAYAYDAKRFNQILKEKPVLDFRNITVKSGEQGYLENKTYADNLSLKLGLISRVPSQESDSPRNPVNSSGKTSINEVDKLIQPITNKPQSYSLVAWIAALLFLCAGVTFMIKR